MFKEGWVLRRCWIKGIHFLFRKLKRPEGGTEVIPGKNPCQGLGCPVLHGSFWVGVVLGGVFWSQCI